MMFQLSYLRGKWMRLSENQGASRNPYNLLPTPEAQIALQYLNIFLNYHHAVFLFTLTFKVHSLIPKVRNPDFFTPVLLRQLLLCENSLRSYVYITDVVHTDVERNTHTHTRIYM